MRRFGGVFAMCFVVAGCDSPSPGPSAKPNPSASPNLDAKASAGGSGSASAGGSGSATAGTLEERAAALHRDAIVIDTHNDITSTILSSGFDLARPNGQTMTDLPRMKAGGITAEFFSIYVDKSVLDRPTREGGGAARRALEMIDITYQQVERHPESLVFATSVDDIRRAKRDGKIAVLMGIEGGHAIEDSLYALRDFYRLGVRYMTLTHTNSNDWADSAGFFETPPPKNHGLSSFGVDVVKEMQRIGMLVDISHVSDETFDAVMKVAQAPVIASHSSARAIANHRRNLSDDMLRALAKNGGVVMVNFYAGFLDPTYSEKMAAFYKANKAAIEELRAKHKDDFASLSREIAKLKASAAVPKVPLSVLIDHIEHVIKVAGPDHVGLGSDFDGVEQMPEGLGGIDALPKITLELLRRGQPEAVVRKVLGENFLRVLAAAETYAKSTKTTLSGDGNTRKISTP